jgi:hypothetical protein
MSLAVLIAFYQANQAAILSILLIISEILGAVPKVKANGFLSFVIEQFQSRLKKGGANDPTP